MVLGVGEVVDECAGEDVDELDVRIADDETPRPAARDRHLERELDRGPTGGRMGRPGPWRLHPSAAAVARTPSSPSSQQVIASPEK